MISNKKKKREFNQRRGDKFRGELIRKATRQELALKEALIECGVIFKFQKVVFDHDKLFILDFYLKTDLGRYTIEIDGGHHFTAKGRVYDTNRSRWLFKRRRIKTLRFSNSEIDNNISECIACILMLKPRIIKN